MVGDPREIIAWTGLRAVDPEPSIPETTPERLTASDIRAAVGMLRRSDRAQERWPVYGDLLLVAHADNWLPFPGLVDFYALWLESAGRREGWKNIEHIRRLIAHALDEALLPPKCERCRGRGQHVAPRGKLHWVSCSLCGGTGQCPLSGRQREQDIGVSHGAWVECWARRYERALRRIRGDHHDALAAARRVLRK